MIDPGLHMNMDTHLCIREHVNTLTLTLTKAFPSRLHFLWVPMESGLECKGEG